MNMAIFIIPMKSAWYKVSNKHLNFEIRSSDTREPPSYTHIQTSIFEFCARAMIFLMNFFSLIEVFRRFSMQKKPEHLKFGDPKFSKIF